MRPPGPRSNLRWQLRGCHVCARSPTVLLGRLIIHLAHQPAVLHEVELVPGGQLSAAHDAGEAVQVVHKVLRLPHHLRGRDPLLARRTFCPETPAGATERLR